jgi:ribosome-associated protein
MTTSSVAKKDTQKLQRAIVDGLEDVKAQDIVVFDTEHLSALFERVIIASGTSNRQTKALAASVRDAVREAGFPKPRIEGEGNGEWIIVDCVQAVVHIMQPTFRQYYHLEELWGEKPVRLKLGAAKPEAPAKKVAAKKVAAKSVEPSLKRSNAAKKGVEEAFPSKAALKKAADKAAGKTPAKKTAAKTTTAAKKASPKSAPVKTAAKTVVVAPSKAAAKKPAAAKKTASSTTSRRKA